MLYILSAGLKNNKHVLNELTQVFGIGTFQAKILCNSLNIGWDCYVVDLTQTLMYQLLKQIEQSNLIVDTELRKQKLKFISYAITIKTFRGIRHIAKLPVRGQRTRTNARTVRKTLLKKKRNIEKFYYESS